MMHRTSTLIAAIIALALALSPGLAEARAGSGGSFGSRGSMTYSAPPATRTAPYGGSSMQRSLTPNNPSPGYGMPGYGYRSRSPFMSGLLGGLIGAGIGGLLFGHGFWHGGLGFFGFFGFLLQIFLLVWLVRFVLRLFRGNGPVFAGGPNMYARGAPPPGAVPVGGPTGGPTGGPMGGGGPQTIAIGPADYEAFEQLLQAIQAAWTAHDLNGLRAMTTPEMAGYFGEQLADQESRGVRNEVRDVRLLQGDLAQAWHESGRDYATVAMRFSMTDVTRERSGRVVDGSPDEHVTATELWTFLRASGGHWILSAIQQAR
jgi:predicted lipid-binding transport protein (Tim44 family)